MKIEEKCYKTQILKDKNVLSEQISTDGVLLRTGHLSFERTFAHKKSFLNSDYSNSQLPIQHSVIQLFLQALSFGVQMCVQKKDDQFSEVH